MYDHKVEIDELEHLKHKQKDDVSSVLESEDDSAVQSMLHEADAGVLPDIEPNANPTWVDNLELANHFGDAEVGKEVVKRVHDLMADDLLALVHERAAEIDEDPPEHEGLIPDFFADTAQAIGGANKPVIDDTLLVSSSHRGFGDDDDDPWSRGGGGDGAPGVPGGSGGPPPGAGGAPDEPPADPNKPKKVTAPVPPTSPESGAKPVPKVPETRPETPRRDDQGRGGKS